jgi:hypothetical protein
MAAQNNPLEVERDNLLKTMREAFLRQDWAGTLTTYEQFNDIKAVRTGIRIEAMCLAARALAASGDRRAAKDILFPLAKRDFPAHRFYGHVARALLDLPDYERAAQICARAASALSEQKQKDAA